MSMERKKLSAGNPAPRKLLEPTSVEVLGKKYATGGHKTGPETAPHPSMGFMAQMIEGLRRADLDPKVVQDLAEGEIFSDEPEDLAKYNKCLRMTVDSQPRKSYASAYTKRKPLELRASP